MIKLILKYILIGLWISGIHGQCTLPLTDGTWYSSTRGTWTVASSQTQIQNFEADLSASTTVATLNCVSSTGNLYVLRANFEIFFGLYIDVYTCLDIRTTSVSPATYIYYTVTPLDSMTGEYFTSDNTSACTNTGYETAVGVHVLLQSGSETSAPVNFPDVILGSYNVTYVTVDGNTVTGSTMNSCNDTTLMLYTNSDTSQKLALTSGGFLHGLHYEQSGSDFYVHTYNNDSTVDSSTTYKIACWVFAYTSTGVAGTVNPKECVSEQTSTSVPYGGQKFTYTPEFTCPLNQTSSDPDITWIIVVAVLGALLLIVILIVVVIWLCTRRQRARQDEEESIIKGERHPSPDSLNEFDVDAEKKKAQEEFRTNSSKAKILQTDPLKDNLEREHTFDLVEVKREKGKKLKEGRQPVKTLGKEDKKRTGQQIKQTPDLVPDPEPSTRQDDEKKDEKRKDDKKKDDGEKDDGKKDDRKKDEHIIDGGKTDRKKKDDEKKDSKKKDDEKQDDTKKADAKRDDKKKDDEKKSDTKMVDERKDDKKKDDRKKDDRKKDAGKKTGQELKKVEVDSQPGTHRSVGNQSIPPAKSESGEVNIGSADDKQPLPAESKRVGGNRPGIQPADGKLSIPPTQPRPDMADQALIKIRKQREEKEKERQERLKKKQKVAEKQARSSDRDTDQETEVVIKHVRESSASDYESDDSTKEERRQKLLAKQRRLRQAAYVPPDGMTDATVVGKKKHRKHQDDEDSDAPHALISRHEQERIDAEKRGRKKALRRLAKRKTKGGHEEDSDNGSEDEDGLKKKRRRKKRNEPKHGLEAPFTQQYLEKKDIEKELDEKDYWHTQEPIKKDDSFVEPMETEEKHEAEMRTPSKLEIIMQEEGDVINPVTGTPLPGMLGCIGHEGNLPEGFIRDKNGNIVRESDGKVITEEEVARQIELNRKLYHLFGLPRLIRNTDGRPVGGYKDDDFGPTAEWDYGGGEEEAGSDEDKKKSEDPESAQSRQVAFSIREDTNGPETPFPEDESSIRRVRQLSSADRQLLRDRLFEQNKNQADIDQQKQPLRVFFKGEKGGVKPDSVYIDNADLSKLAKLRPPHGAKSNMIARSDTFDDARTKRGQNPHFKRNNRLRSSWSSSYARSQIPEGAEVEGGENTMASAPNKRNLGSDDEFVLVAGSVQKLHRPAREESLLSDISMRTAPDSVKPPDERRLRPYFGDFYKDKKYFDHYLATEEMRTNAAVETRELATHGIDFLYDRAEYWKDHDPVPPKPPSSALGLYLSRNHTMYTIADSGLQSMRSSAADTGRPQSANALQDGAGRLSKRENTRDVTFGSTPRTPHATTARTDPTNTEDRQLTDRSDRSRATVGWSDREPSQGDSVILVRQKSDSGLKLREKSSVVDKPEPIQELQEENVVAGTVLTVTDTY